MESTISADLLQARGQFKRYREEGVMAGVWRWLDELDRSIDTLTSIGFHRDMKEIAPENGWKRFEPSPDTRVTLIFADGAIKAKTFTPGQFRGEQP